MKFISKILILSILTACVISLTINPKEQRMTNLNTQAASNDQTKQAASNDQTKQADTKSTDNSSTSPSLDTGSDSGSSDKKDLGNGFIKPTMVPEGTLPLQNNWADKRKK